MIMTAAVDMKPTLTIIKAEKMDGEYRVSRRLGVCARARLLVRPYVDVFHAKSLAALVSFFGR